MAGSLTIAVKRIFDDAVEPGGARFLVDAAKSEERNNAVALGEWLERR